MAGIHLAGDAAAGRSPLRAAAARRILVAWYADVGLPILLPFLLLVFRLQRYLRDPTLTGCAWPRMPRPSPRSQRCWIAGTSLTARAVMCRSRASRSGSSSTGSGSHLRRWRAARRRSPTSRRDQAGETIALVGGTGAGKSTLINLLCRLYDPTAGEIGVDGIRLADIDLASWRRRIAIAGQDAELLGGTIRDNIAYGDPDADHARIVQAAEQASIHSFVESLPQRYDSLVGTRGMQLSGGERQRISLARALLRRPDIV